MKYVLSILAAFGLLACNPPERQTKALRLAEPPAHDGAPADPNGDKAQAPHRQGKAKG